MNHRFLLRGAPYSYTAAWFVSRTPEGARVPFCHTEFVKLTQSELDYLAKKSIPAPVDSTNAASTTN
ncbi:MAG: hypothetical protein LBD20_08220 [Spirochaetaceae bacterium]|nr:hypothetical protein [Spirochaetaceae bacterium]